MLRDRERRVLGAGAAAAALIVLVSYQLVPGLGQIRTLGRARVQAEKDLSELRAAVPEIRRLEAGIKTRKELLSRAARTAPDSPLIRLTARLQESGFPQSAFSVKSGGVKDGEFFKEESFDIRIENRSYLEIVRFLEKLEDGTTPVALRSLGLKSRYENRNAVDAVLRVGYLLPR